VQPDIAVAANNGVSKYQFFKRPLMAGLHSPWKINPLHCPPVKAHDRIFPTSRPYAYALATALKPIQACVAHGLSTTMISISSWQASSGCCTIAQPVNQRCNDDDGGKGAVYFFVLVEKQALIEKS
jgi:hypothetical protein